MQDKYNKFVRNANTYQLLMRRLHEASREATQVVQDRQ